MASKKKQSSRATVDNDTDQAITKYRQSSSAISRSALLTKTIQQKNRALDFYQKKQYDEMFRDSDDELDPELNRFRDITPTWSDRNGKRRQPLENRSSRRYPENEENTEGNSSDDFDELRSDKAEDFRREIERERRRLAALEAYRRNRLARRHNSLSPPNTNEYRRRPHSHTQDAILRIAIRPRITLDTGNDAEPVSKSEPPPQANADRNPAVASTAADNKSSKPTQTTWYDKKKSQKLRRATDQDVGSDEEIYWKNYAPKKSSRYQSYPKQQNRRSTSTPRDRNFRSDQDEKPARRRVSIVSAKNEPQEGAADDHNTPTSNNLQSAGNAQAHTVPFESRSVTAGSPNKTTVAGKRPSSLTEGDELHNTLAPPARPFSQTRLNSAPFRLNSLFAGDSGGGELRQLDSAKQTRPYGSSRKSTVKKNAPAKNRPERVVFGSDEEDPEATLEDYLKHLQTKYA